MSHEQDLDQLRFLGLEVRDHPQLFERRRIEILRLVHDQESEPSRRPLVNEKSREVMQQIWLAAAVTRVQPEVEQDRLEQIARIQHRIDET